MMTIIKIIMLFGLFLIVNSGAILLTSDYIPTTDKIIHRIEKIACFTLIGGIVILFNSFVLYMIIDILL